LIEVLEQYADELVGVYLWAGAVRSYVGRVAAVYAASNWDTAWAARHAAVYAVHLTGNNLVEPPAQAELLRDLFNPFRRVTLSPSWLSWGDGTIPKLCGRIYHEWEFTALPVLADALEEAGCTDTTVLSHCRGERAHARGCWVLDLVLQ
jgi:hypothetical protein